MMDVLGGCCGVGGGGVLFGSRGADERGGVVVVAVLGCRCVAGGRGCGGAGAFLDGFCFE